MQPSKPSADPANKISGDLLPETSRDERESHSPDDEAEHEQWLRDNIPPHHG